jgi:hypothetical protein
MAGDLQPQRRCPQRAGTFESCWRQSKTTIAYGPDNSSPVVWETGPGSALIRLLLCGLRFVPVPSAGKIPELQWPRRRDGEIDSAVLGVCSRDRERHWSDDDRLLPDSAHLRPRAHNLRVPQRANGPWPRVAQRRSRVGRARFPRDLHDSRGSHHGGRSLRRQTIQLDGQSGVESRAYPCVKSLVRQRISLSSPTSKVSPTTDRPTRQMGRRRASESHVERLELLL